MELEVIPDPAGGWRVVVNGDDGRSRPASHFDSLEEALPEAEAYLAGHLQRGSLVVYSKAGFVDYRTPSGSNAQTRTAARP